MENDTDVLIRFFKNLRKAEKSVLNARERLSQSLDCSSCSYTSGYIRQSVSICKTCKTDEGLCAGCSLNCHKGHEIVEIGPKKSFRCDCGTVSRACSLFPNKTHNANFYNHNFRGRFCLCDKEDSDSRESDMYMCVCCFDWFHTDCIRIYNDCHNFSLRKFHQINIPIVPDNPTHYFFICETCIQSHLYLPNIYFQYIYLENNEERKVPGQIFEKFPYHCFVEKKWFQERSPEFCFIDAYDHEFVSIKKRIQEFEVEEVSSDEEILLVGSHEEQINLARGVAAIREILAQALQQDLRQSLRNELQEFKKRVLEYHGKKYL